MSEGQLDRPPELKVALSPSPQLQHCHRAQLPVYNQRVLKMLFRWVLCTLLILQSTFSASRTIEEPKVRAFRRAGEVDEFVSVSRTHTHTLLAIYIAVVSSYQKKICGSC